MRLDSLQSGFKYKIHLILPETPGGREGVGY